MENQTEGEPASPISPVPEGNRGGSRSALAYERLKQKIKNRELQPGHRMREAEIAGWLGISRTPVRDALKQLESDGLVTAAPRRGLVVTELDQQQVTEIYALRDVLEGLAARMAAEHATSAEIAAMHDAIDRHSAVAIEDAATHAALNRTFHQLLYRSARNRYLLDVLQSIEGFLALLPGTTYEDPSRPPEALKEHEEIVESIDARDPDEAERRARYHIRQSERVRLLMLSSRD